LKGAIFGAFTVAQLIILALLFYFVPRQVESFLLDRLETHGRAVAREVAARSFPAGRSTAAGPAELPTAVDPEVRAMLVLSSTGGVASRGNVPPSEVQEIVNRYRALGNPDKFDGPKGLVVVESLVPPEGGPPSGSVLVELDRSRVDGLLAGLRRTVLYTCILGFLLFIALVYLVYRFFILRPLREMLGVASKLSEADLTGRVAVDTADELGTLAEALNRTGQSLRDTLGRIRGVSEGVAGVIEQISRTGSTVSGGASTTLSRVEETSSSIEQMRASLLGIAENVEVLYQSAEASSSSITQMAATNEEVAENVQAMAASVEGTTSAIEEMTYSIREVAKNVEELHARSEETASSMNEMDVSIGQVETNANETARLSEQVSSDAASGVEALRNTLAGIEKIKESSRSAASVIESLGRRISEIGNILNVIDDVAEQTNLLALNAAIIAAQAGEHGKGFAVVAEEIKDLAERTGASTKEIAELIRGVQEESRNAVGAMGQGVRLVETGVQLGREAESALKKIHESANKSTMMVKAIARATVEQARGSRVVTGAIQRIVETVQQISKATNEQARGSEQIMKSAEQMKLITQHVQRSSHEQANGSKQITKAIENINEMVGHLNRAQREQTMGSEQVLKAVDAIKFVAEHQTRSVRQLEEAIESLQKQAEVLRAEVRRFRV
jgi:methyl-accepting chemotaxis protein